MYGAPVGPGGSRLPGNRGPWWVQVVVSSLILLAYLVAQVAAYAVGDTTERWTQYGLSGAVLVVFVVITATWARSGWRVIVAVLLGLLFVGLERLALLPFYLDLSVTQEWSADVFRLASMAATAMLLTGLVVVWSVARRRTAMTWVGLLPAAGLIALGTWATYYHQPDFGVDLTATEVTLPLHYWIGVVAFESVFGVAAVLVLWACDAIGLATRRSVTTSTPNVQSFRTTQLYRTQAGHPDLRETERYRPPPPPLAQPPRRLDDPSFRTTQIRRPHDSGTRDD
ncbi:hypothetical protein [Gordonia sp. C13]|uniref:hypothetical protein n=1 Tax=Gordonia sp. C13 TaxID=2935078 RepID=UPI00200A714B|nr:hypothetical protein [Gordonia sp. C13]MCK8612573.1 hypothetical protein [Gordonia sp. C13]